MWAHQSTPGRLRAGLNSQLVEANTEPHRGAVQSSLSTRVAAPVTTQPSLLRDSFSINPKTGSGRGSSQDFMTIGLITADLLFMHFSPL